jgi:hypothetical protein
VKAPAAPFIFSLFDFIVTSMVDRRVLEAFR